MDSSSPLENSPISVKNDSVGKVVSKLVFENLAIYGVSQHFMTVFSRFLTMCSSSGIFFPRAHCHMKSVCRFRDKAVSRVKVLP